MASAIKSRLLRHVDTAHPDVQRVRYLDHEIGVVVRDLTGHWAFYGNTRNGYFYREGRGFTRSQAVLSAYPLPASGPVGPTTG